MSIEDLIVENKVDITTEVEKGILECIKAFEEPKRTWYQFNQKADVMKEVAKAFARKGYFCYKHYRQIDNKFDGVDIYKRESSKDQERIYG